MPHMMPMMWIILYFCTLLTLMITISLIYFFFLPDPALMKPKGPKNLIKWTWMW